MIVPAKNDPVMIQCMHYRHKLRILYYLGSLPIFENRLVLHIAKSFNSDNIFTLYLLMPEEDYDLMLTS